MSNRKNIRLYDSSAIVMTKSDFKNQMALISNGALAEIVVNLPFTNDENNGTIEANAALFLQGKDNKFPQNLRKILGKSPIYKVGLKYSSQQLAGLGLQTGIEEIRDGVETFTPTVIQGWKDFAKRANFMSNYYIKACRALKTYNMCYVHIALSEENKIANATVLPNHRCRLWGNTLTGEVSQVIVADWEKIGKNVTVDNSKSYPIIDNWFDTAVGFQKKITENKTEKEYVFVLRLPSDDVIYNLPDHYTVVESGLIDYANNIVNFKKWVMENLTTLNQIMFVTEEYMQTMNPEWSAWHKISASGGEKGKLAQEKIDKAWDDLAANFQKSASGVENSSKLIQAPMYADGKESIKIVKVDQNTFDQQYNEDANWVEKQIHWALQIDAGLYGSVEGKNNNGGSAKTQTFNIAQLNEWIYEQVLIELPSFIADFNGFGVDKFRVRRATMYSSDALSATDRQVSNPME